MQIESTEATNVRVGMKYWDITIEGAFFAAYITYLGVVGIAMMIHELYIVGAPPLLVGPD